MVKNYFQFGVFNKKSMELEMLFDRYKGNIAILRVVIDVRRIDSVHIYIVHNCSFNTETHQYKIGIKLCYKRIISSYFIT